VSNLDWQHPPLFASAAEHEAARLAHAQSPTPNSALWLAWCERESNRAGSEALVQGLGDLAALPAAMRRRVRLIQLEHGLALGLDDNARQQAPLLLADCLASDDALCTIDVYHHLAGLAEQRADVAARRGYLEQAAQRAREQGDTRRAMLFEANQARMESVLDRPAAEARWGVALPAKPEALEALSDEVRAAVADFRGLLCGLRAEHEACVRWLQIAFEAARRTGQVRRAIVAASNLGYFQGQMGAYSEALHWLQKGLALARAHGYPSLTGGLLVHSAEVLRLLGQLDLADDSLREAFTELQRVPAGRNLCVAHNVKGRIALERDDHLGALAAYETMQTLPAIAAADLRGMAGIGRARALLGLSRIDEALLEIDTALHLLHDQAYAQLQVEALGVRAEALAHQGEGGQRSAISVFEQAIELARSLPGHDPDARLLESAARTYAAQGQHARALKLALQANATRQRQFTRETAQRASGLRAMHEVERAQTENEHLRRVAELESSRYELLLRLNEVSQEIICELEAERVYAALERQVHQLLDAQCVAVYVLDDALPQMNFAFGVEMGEAFIDPPIPLDDPASYCARCVREGAEFVLGGNVLADPRNEIPGTTEMPSMMFMPLRLGPRIIGAMTVQCTRLGAYGEREQLVFRMLCAYGAIALENARAYRRLTELQRHVLTQEKLAALGAMVAGVAHELNTPIGNSLLVASSMREAAGELLQAVQAGQAMRRSELVDKVRQVHEGLSVIERGMGSASSLVRSFKQVAVDRSSEKRRSFEVLEACQHCAQALGIALRRTKLSLQLDVAPGLRIDSFPGALDQVLMILVNNAMFHAFEPEAEGRIELGGRLMPNGGVRLWVADNGKGMPPSVLARVFEPFFTTRFGQGGSGLGLSIAHNLVHGILGGRLEVTSTPGVGSRFTLLLPVQTPD
jgi:signal transduction histidine kinase/tetratricopeptide (TPR) repeat protein